MPPRTHSSTALKTGPVRDLMDYIAQSVQKFLQDFGSATPATKEEPLLMGFTFSFVSLSIAPDRGGGMGE